MVVGPGLKVGVQIGENAVFIGARVKTHIAAAFNISRHIHLARAVHSG